MFIVRGEGRGDVSLDNELRVEVVLSTSLVSCRDLYLHRYYMYIYAFPDIYLIVLYYVVELFWCCTLIEAGQLACVVNEVLGWMND